MKKNFKKYFLLFYIFSVFQIFDQQNLYSFNKSNLAPESILSTLSINQVSDLISVNLELIIGKSDIDSKISALNIIENLRKLVNPFEREQLNDLSIFSLKNKTNEFLFKYSEDVLPFNVFFNDKDILFQLNFDESMRLLKFMISYLKNTKKSQKFNFPVIGLPLVKKADLVNFLNGNSNMVVEQGQHNIYGKTDMINYDTILLYNSNPDAKANLDDLSFITIEGKKIEFIDKEIFKNCPFNKKLIGSLDVNGENIDIVLVQNYNSMGFKIELYKNIDGAPGWKKYDYKGFIGYINSQSVILSSSSKSNFLKIHTGDMSLFNFNNTLKSDLNFSSSLIDFCEKGRENHGLLIDPNFKGNNLAGLITTLAFSYAYDVLKLSEVSVVDPSIDGEYLYKNLNLTKVQPIGQIPDSEYIVVMTAISKGEMNSNPFFSRDILKGREGRYTYQGSLDFILKENFRRLQWRFKNISNSWLFEFLRMKTNEFAPLELTNFKILDQGEIKNDYLPLYFYASWNSPMKNSFIRGNPKFYVFSDKLNRFIELEVENLKNYDEQGGYEFNYKVMIPTFISNKSIIKARAIFNSDISGGVKLDKGIQIHNFEINLPPNNISILKSSTNIAA